MIYGADSRADSLFLLVDGVVMVSRMSAAGGETVLGLERPDSFFGVTGVLGDARRSESAVTLRSCAVMEWPLAELETLMVRTPALGPALMRVVARKLVEAREHIDSLALDFVPQRLIKALLRLGEQFGKRRDESSTIRLMPLSHQILARHLGTSREIVTSHMLRLRKRGLLQYSRAGLEFDPCALQGELQRSRDKAAQA